MKQIHPEYQRRLFSSINDSPFPNHMQMKITEISWGSCTFILEPAAFRLQPFGVVHGGNIATLIDSATFWACYLPMETDEDGLTSVDLKLNYLAPARQGLLRCVGTMMKRGK